MSPREKMLINRIYKNLDNILDDNSEECEEITKDLKRLLILHKYSIKIGQELIDELCDLEGIE